MMMKPTSFALLILLFSLNGFSQVGIGTTNPAGALDITSNNSGVLVPRVALTSRATAAPVMNPQTGPVVAGTLIWNTATAGTAPNNVTPGFYYWNGSAWNPISGSTGREWSLDGNSITNPSIDFIGTTSNHDFRVRTNNNERFIFTANGRLRSQVDGSAAEPTYSWNNGAAATQMGMFRSGGNGIGFSTVNTERFRIPNANQVHAMSLGSATAPFYSFSADTNTGMYSTGADALAFSTSGTQRLRMLSNGQVVINNTGAPVAGNQFSVYSTSYSINGYSNGPNGTGVYGESTIANGAGMFGYNPHPSGTGIVGSGQSGAGNFLTSGSGGAFSANTTGLYSYTTSSGIARALYMSDAYGAFWNAGYWAGAGLGYYKIIGNGAVSTIVKGLDDEEVVMHCTETPENLFEDYGIGVLKNGKAHIKIDPIFAKNIIVNDKYPMKVFIQLEGECNGVYVTNKTADSFDVIELQNGTSNAPFSYSIVANRADETFTGPNGETRVAHYGTRFEPAPIREKTSVIEKSK